MPAAVEPEGGSAKAQVSLKTKIAKPFNEFIGTFFLSFTVAVSAGVSPLAGFAIGSTLMVMVYAGGHVSGAHYNPAVTFAIALTKKIKPVDAIIYMIAQVVGAIVAGLCGKALMGEKTGYPGFGVKSIEMGESALITTMYNEPEALLVEILLTWALCSVVLNVACTEAQANNSYFGLAIGFTVVSGAISVGGVSGGAFNPAVGMLPLTAASTGVDISYIWVYWVGPLIGAFIAAFFFRVTRPNDLDTEGNAIFGALEKVSAPLMAVAPMVVEFIGTFFLCFTVTMAAGKGAPLAALSIGSILMVMIYMGGDLSGANFNPAVTIALKVRGASNTEPAKMAGYIFAQLLGSILAGIFGNILIPGGVLGSPVPADHNDLGPAIIAEIIGTFALCHVVLQVATSKATVGNSHFGLSIGFTVFAMAVALGGISGGGFNPAVGTGLNIFSTAGAKFIWIYWLGPIVGAVLAGGFFHLTEKDEEGRHFQLHTSGGGAEKNFNLQMPAVLGGGEVLA